MAPLWLFLFLLLVSLLALRWLAPVKRQSRSYRKESTKGQNILHTHLLRAISKHTHWTSKTCTLRYTRVHTLLADTRSYTNNSNEWTYLMLTLEHWGHVNLMKCQRERKFINNTGFFKLYNDLTMVLELCFKK